MYEYLPSFFLIILLAGAISPVSQAEIYQWKDEQGNVYFGDSPPETIKEKTNIDIVESSTVIKDTKEDAQRRKDNAKAWYKERQEMRVKQDHLEKRKKSLIIAERRQRAKRCAKYTKKRDDAKEKLRAHKRAGVRPRLEKSLNIQIEQYERDVEYYCR